MQVTQVKQRNIQLNIVNVDSQYKDKLNFIVPILKNWNYDKLERLFVREFPELTNDFDNILLQYIYYLIMCCISPSNLSVDVPSDIVDKLWHCHLWLNKDYNTLTTLIYGEIIIHEPHV